MDATRKPLASVLPISFPMPRKDDSLFNAAAREQRRALDAIFPVRLGVYRGRKIALSDVLCASPDACCNYLYAKRTVPARHARTLAEYARSQAARLLEAATFFDALAAKKEASHRMRGLKMRRVRPMDSV